MHKTTKLLSTAAIVTLLSACGAEQNTIASEENESNVLEEVSTNVSPEEEVVDENEEPEVVEEENDEPNQEVESENEEIDGVEEVSAVEVPLDLVGNYSGNIAVGGQVAKLGDRIFAADMFDEGFGIYEIGEKPTLIVGDVMAESLHVTEEGIYFIDSDMEQMALQFHSFADGSTDTLAEGYILTPQMADGKLWMMMEQSYPEQVEGTHLYTYDLAGETWEQLPQSEVRVAVTDDVKLIQFESFLYHLDEGGEIGELVSETVAGGPVIIDGTEVYYAGFEGLMLHDMTTGEEKMVVDGYFDFVNARDGVVFYSPYVEAEVERQFFMHDIASDETTDLSEVGINSVHLFEGEAITQFGRQGIVAYDRIDLESKELSEVLFWVPGM